MIKFCYQIIVTWSFKILLSRFCYQRMLSNLCYQNFVFEIYSCFVIKSSAKNSFRDIKKCSVIKQRLKCFIEHDDDITFFSFSQIFLSTTTILHFHRFHNFFFIKHIHQSQLMFVFAFARLTQFFFVFKNFLFRKLLFIKVFIRISFSNWIFLIFTHDDRFVQKTNN